MFVFLLCNITHICIRYQYDIVLGTYDLKRHKASLSISSVCWMPMHKRCPLQLLKLGLAFVTVRVFRENGEPYPCTFTNSLVIIITIEIAPRSGLLRVREFCMGEIEHFVNPKDKSHANFSSVADKKLALFGATDQLTSGKTKNISVGEAVKGGLINNETLAYFMARTQLFMERIGMDPTRCRFRQHLKTEMAHYAADCWDLEIQTSYGWVECVGHADRACYDLEVHAKQTNTPMLATLKLDKPQEIEIAKLKFNRKALGQAFKQDQRTVSGALEALAEDWEDFAPIAEELEKNGKVTVDGFEVTSEMLTYTKNKKMVHEIKFTPSVIEPSFGIGRILYSLLEHSFYQRDFDEQRCVMKFKPEVAPQKCAVLPISSCLELNEVVRTFKSVELHCSVCLY